MALNESEYILPMHRNLGVLFLEAIAYRSHPQTKVLNKLILENEIGQIENI